MTRTPCRALDFIGRGIDPNVFFDTLVEEYFMDKGNGCTDNNYLLKFKRWKTFNLMRGRPDCLLDGLTDQEKTNEWILFVLYLDNVGIKEHYMKEHLSAVKNILGKSANNFDLNFADSSKSTLLKRVITLCLYTAEEQEERSLKRQQTQSMPIADEMIDYLHDVLWVRTDYSAFGLERKAAWVAMVIMLVKGSRISNCVKTASKHAVKCKNVVLVYMDGIVRRTYTGGSRLPVGFAFDNTYEVQLTFQTSKTSKVPDTLTFRRTDDRWAEMGVLAITKWMEIQFEFTRANELLTTSFGFIQGRYKKGKQEFSTKYLQAKFVNEQIKLSAVEAGLNPSHFSSKSFRKRLASMVQLDKITGSMADLVGGWKAGSRTRQAHYATGSVAYPGLGVGAGYTLNLLKETMVQNLCPTVW